MAIERTLSIIKPDAMKKNVMGKILAMFEEKGLKIVAGKIMTLSYDDAALFYDIHKARPFFGELVDFMTSGPVFVSVLEGEGAVALNRQIMGATDPSKAEPGTIRAFFGGSIGENAVHGSDELANAQKEIAQFFPELA
jgi:nucleoside-diphosphate kinase